jgi:hypothetical protein
LCMGCASKKMADTVAVLCSIVFLKLMEYRHYRAPWWDLGRSPKRTLRTNDAKTQSCVFLVDQVDMSKG